MSDVKNWMPKRPEWNTRTCSGFINEIRAKIQTVFDRWYANEIESLFKDANVYYGQLDSLNSPVYLKTTMNNKYDTYEFLVIARPIEKPKKTDRELLEAIVNELDAFKQNAMNGNVDQSKLFNAIDKAREALKERDE